jgi:hypothetical protein
LRTKWATEGATYDADWLARIGESEDPQRRRLGERAPAPAGLAPAVAQDEAHEGWRHTVFGPVAGGQRPLARRLAQPGWVAK